MVITFFSWYLFKVELLILQKAIASKLLKTKKKEISEPQSSDSGTSQSTEMKNGNQEGEDTTNMEEQSQNEAADDNESAGKV